jgi:peptidoglycan/xylan/chitin deacetylase (PgdA/CDA1 family)
MVAERLPRSDPRFERLAIHRAFLDAFAKHNVRGAYGFINAHKLADHAEDRAALEAWVAAGQPLGNHTFTHPDLAKIGVDAYVADIDANEALLKDAMGASRERDWKVFRYPFLVEGTDRASYDRIRAHLGSHSYRVAEVTIDFYDWAYNNPYARCLEKHDERSIEALKDTWRDESIVFLRWADAAARDLFGRPIKHILLLHVGAFGAEMIDELLTTYEKNGVRFVPVDEALRDPVYATEPRDPKIFRGTFLRQVRAARGTKTTPQPDIPDALLDIVCR